MRLCVCVCKCSCECINVCARVCRPKVNIKYLPWCSLSLSINIRCIAFWLAGLVRFLLLWWSTQSKVTWGWKTLFYLTACGPSSREVRAGSQGRNLETGTDAQVMKRCYLLTGSFYFLFHKDHPPRSGTTSAEWTLIYISRQLETFTAGLPAGQYGRDIFSVEVPSSQMILACVKLTQKLAMEWP